MHEETAESIQNAAQVIEDAAQVDVGNADMPVLMELQRLLETGSLRDGLLFHRDNNPACFNARQTLRSFLIRSLRYLKGRTLSPFPAEAGPRNPYNAEFRC